MAPNAPSSAQDANRDSSAACRRATQPEGFGIHLLGHSSIKTVLQDVRFCDNGDEGALKLYELSFWSVTSSGQGRSLCQVAAKDKATWPLVDAKNNHQDTGPSSL